jgi:imidazole glycerol-phosphate synthase subunit HisH
MIVIVDSGVSNLGSVQAALRRVGAPGEVTTDGEVVRRADAVVLPGVGAFGDAMTALRERKLVEPIRAAAADGIPILGVCLGMQLLADQSEEFGWHEGIGLIPGQVVRLEPRAAGERVPNMGWCDVTPGPDAVLFRNVAHAAAFYFVHSYRFACQNPSDIAATISYGGGHVAAAVQHKNVHGVQFHPEKSQDAGLEVLAEFLALASGHAHA